MVETKTLSRHHHGNLKEALVEYALDAARAGVLNDLSLRQASRDLGVSPGAAYRHFKDRNSLMRHVAQRGFDELASRFEAAIPFASQAQTSGDARDRFLSLAHAYVAFSKDNPTLWRLMFGRFGLSSSSETARPSTYEWLSKSLVELAVFDVIRPPDGAAQFFAWSAIHGLSDLSSSPAVSFVDDKTVIEAHCEFILAALS
ncbi:MAG: TetR/AcrR family transcriptional regulator [Pseudomonadota bacterium]